MSTSSENFFFKFSKMSIFEDCVKIAVYPPQSRSVYYMMNNHQFKPPFVTLCIQDFQQFCAVRNAATRWLYTSSAKRWLGRAAGYCHFASDVWRPHPIYSSISIRMTQLRSERSLAGAVTAKVNRGEYMALHFIQSNVSQKNSTT